MSCLLPQFNCLPDSFSVQFKSYTHHSPNQPKCREPISCLTRCILSTTAPPVLTESTVCNLKKLKLPSLDVHSNSGVADRQWSSSSSSTSTTAGVLDIEKFQLPSFESNSNSMVGSRPWAYSDAVGQVNKGTSLPSEFVKSDYADAAAEAIALARAAVKVAKSAAAMMKNHQSPKQLTVNEKLKLPESDISVNELGSQLSEEDEPTIEELQLLEEQLSASITVRSKRQVERKERRIRAAEKADAGVVSVKSASAARGRVAPTTVATKSGLSRRRGERKDVLAFLGGMTNAKLLTAAEEVELSKGIQDLLKLQEVHSALETRFGVPPTFAEWASAAGIDQIQLGRRLHHGEECRDKMVRSNIRLVISVARGYYGTKVHLQDIVQEGIRGLVKSAEKFDASKGFKFSTYAHWWIRQAVQRSRAEQSRIIHVPYYMVEVQSKVNEARYRLDKELGRKPTRAEIAVETGLSIKRIQSAEQAPKPARSIDIPVGLDNNTKLTDLLDDPDQETPEEILIKQTMSADLSKVLSTLSEKEQKVIRWRFGLGDGKTRTLQEIGDVMGVSRERVRQIEMSAFHKLRNTDRTETLRQYLPQ
ncbi:RNA polymerase sigma factor sigB-like [Rutidosis leptorrhynchoides]|uniref:RNA polymerase sigma factor sigB-like n=1 Tax=Rutidosis leptorrhynchoides TaxID=125765 RepID=UPI003A990730